jgi:signal-transduction protein with cAMP-binding, CBS, and nucleotidyltransferase domain
MNGMRTVKEIMKPVLNIGPNQTVLEAANVMKESGYGSLLIVDGKITVGIVTVRDLVMRVIAKDLPHTTPISEVMSSPLITIDANVSLKKAARLMGERKIRRLPVIESGGVIGVLVAFDVLRQLTNKTLADEVWEAIGLEH